MHISGNTNSCILIVFSISIGNNIDVANLTSYHFPALGDFQEQLGNVPVLVEVIVHSVMTKPEKVSNTYQCCSTENFKKQQ